MSSIIFLIAPFFFHNRLNVKNRSAVNHVNPPDRNYISFYPCIFHNRKTNRIGPNRGTCTEDPHWLFLVGRFLNEITGIKIRAFMEMKYHNYVLALPYILGTFGIFLIDNDLSLGIRYAPVPWYVCLLCLYKSYGYKFYFRFIVLFPSELFFDIGLISGHEIIPGCLFCTFPHDYHKNV